MAPTPKAPIVLALAALVAALGGGYLFQGSRAGPELRVAAARARKLADAEHAGKEWEWPSAFADVHPEARWRIESVCFNEGGRRPRVVGPDGVIRTQSCLVDAAQWLDDIAEESDERRASAWIVLGFVVPCLGLSLLIGRRQRALARALRTDPTEGDI